LVCALGLSSTPAATGSGESTRDRGAASNIGVPSFFESRFALVCELPNVPARDFTPVSGRDHERYEGAETEQKDTHFSAERLVTT
jgi:hypothetical protein